MRSLLIITTLVVAFVFAESDKGFSCNKIFEERKSELIIELNKIDEQQQALESLQHATQKVLDAKEEKIKNRELVIEANLKKIEQTRDEIKKIYENNEKVLAEISKEKDDKIVETYTKMKAGPAASVISEMKNDIAASIMFNLTPKQSSKILAKMDPAKAAKLTELLKKGPPFNTNK